MMAGDTIEQRLRRIESEAAIRDLIHRYALNIRRGDPAACAALFVDDAVFETRAADPSDPAAGAVRSRIAGREAIIAHIGRSAASARVCPSISNLLIEIDGDSASATCLMSARVSASGAQIHGEYSDTFRRDTHWRFASRLYTILAQTAG